MRSSDGEVGLCLTEVEISSYLSRIETREPRWTRHLVSCAQCRCWLAECARGSQPTTGLVDPFSGLKLGRYELLERVGRGGRGVVYEAYDTRLERRVAIMLLRDTKVSRTKEFEDEGKAMARLEHPNIVTVFDVAAEDGEPFIAMEFVAGQTLEAWSDTKRSWRDVVRIYNDIAKGLSALHDAGLSHGDFKPTNVLISLAGIPKIADFGFSTEHGKQEPELRGLTPAFAAPERLKGECSTPASDQYSFFLALRDSLSRTGAAAPTWLRRAEERGTRSAPGDRFASMAAASALLAKGLAKRKRRILTAAVALGIAAASVPLWWQRGDLSNSTETHFCESLDDAFDSSWSPKQQAKHVERAGLEPSQAALAKRALGAYVQAWHDEHASLCSNARSQRPDPTFYAQRDCLERSQADLTRWGDGLQRDELHRKTVLADIYKLTPPTTCSATPFLASKRQASEYQRKYEREGREELEALIHAGKWAEGIRKADQIHADAIAKGEDWVASDVLIQQAGLVLRSATPQDASELYQRAIVLSERARADDLRLLALLEAMTTAIHFGEFENAEKLGERAEALLERLGSPPQPRLSYLHNHAILTQRLQGAKQALPLLEGVVAASEQFYPDGHPEIADEYWDLAENELHLQAWDDAFSHAAKAQAIWEQAYGHEHHLVALALGTKGEADIRRGNQESGLAIVEEGLAIQERNGDGDSPRAMGIHMELCSNYALAGREDAMASCDRSLAISRTIFGANSAEAVKKLIWKARILQNIAKNGDSVLILEEALAIAVENDFDDLHFRALYFLANGLDEIGGQNKRVLSLLEQALAGYSARGDARWVGQVQAALQAIKSRK